MDRLDEALGTVRVALHNFVRAQARVVDARDIRRFADAIGDPSPLYRDPEFARGKLLLIETDTVYVDQQDRLIATARSTEIRR